MKILWITNMPTIYRVHFFNELGKKCNLDVVFERFSATGIENKWEDSLAKTFTPYFLNSKPVGREGSITTSIFKYINKSYDLIVVSSYSSPTEMLAILKLNYIKVPYVLAVDGGIIKNENIIKKNIKKYFIGSALTWLSTSQQTDKYLEYYGAKKEDIYRYPFTSLYKEDILDNLIEENEKIEIRNKLCIPEEKMILAVGQFIYRKGFDILLKACKNIDSNVGVYIIGGKVTDEYKQIIEQYNLKNIHFIQNISKEKLKLYYKSADLFVLPTREDIWGLVINEAMAHGLPVITTDKCVSGLELIENNINGFIVPKEDSEILADKINSVLRDNDLKLYMSKNSLKKIKEYTIENMALRHIDIFNSIHERG